MSQAPAEPAVVGQPEHWALTSPDRPAVVDGTRVLTYGEWNDLADRLAESLSQLGAARQRACVRSHQSFEWFVIVLALSKLSWEHVAVNWRLTPTEVRAIIDDCQPDVFFFDDLDPGPLIAESVAAGTRPVRVGPPCDGTVAFASLVAQPGAPRRQSERISRLVTYSSGTTGRPKGIRKRPPPPQDAAALLRNRTEVATVLARRSGYSRALLSLPLHHGTGPRAARRCHERGGTVYLLDKFDPLRALEIIDRERITHWKVVPTMLHRVRALGEEVLGSFDVSSLKSVSVGSAPTSWRLKLWACDYFGDVLFEGYGASEIGMVAAMPPKMHRRKPGSCGKVNEPVHVRVLGPDGQELPRGQQGELWIKTPLMINSYLNGTPLSDDLLSPDGFFHTGDVGKLDEDGYLFITGRSKDMIISGGVNIFPVEVEQALMEHPALLDAAVFGVPDSEFGERVVAFCEVRPGTDLSADELLSFVEPFLASFKRPRLIRFVTELPRNDVGKVLKNELRRRYAEQAAS
jgi:long-chain acyl-CoA synthetase